MSAARIAKLAARDSLIEERDFPMEKQNRHILVLGSLGISAAIVAACGSQSSPPPLADCDAGDVSCTAFDSGTDARPSSSSGGEGGNEAGASDGGNEDGGDGTTTSGEAGTDGGCPTGNTVTVVHNFNDWCTVGLNGAATSVSALYEACVGAGFSVSIVAGPASSAYELGPNPFVRITGAEVPDGGGPGIVGDGGFGSTKTVDVGDFGETGISCVLLCCPFADGTGCDSSQSGYTTFLSQCP